MRNAGRSTTWAGRSLSSENGSSAPSTPSTNGPPGTTTDVPASPARPGGRVRTSSSSGGPVRRFKCLQHRFVVLVLVADHHSVHEIVVRFVGQLVECVQRRGPHGATVGPRLIGRQQRQVDAAGAGVHEGVVEVFDRAGQDSRPVRVAAAQQPQFLLLADVRQVPDQRAHQRVVLAMEFGIVEIHQPQGSFARPVQIADQRFA